MTTTAPAPRTLARPAARATPARRAALYVVGLLWALPLLAFSLAAARADATPCVAVDGMPCDAQGVVVTTGVLAAGLLIPVGLVALLVVALLARSRRRPAAVAAVAVATGLAVGLFAVGVGYLVLS
ncbi:MAG TPA: hypothetical protein VEV65_13800 [Kineosporiaceae bacterium]|nr:hypothetical protein [Kineosporiaceae bacterium]